MLERRAGWIEPCSLGERPALKRLLADIEARQVDVVSPTIGFDRFYVLVIVRLERRKLVWINVTPHPTAEWIARQVTQAFPWDEAPRYLIRDRDPGLRRCVHPPIPGHGHPGQANCPGSSRQNGFAERLIGSIRRERVDHIVVLSEAHIRRILTR